MHVNDAPTLLPLVEIMLPYLSRNKKGSREVYEQLDQGAVRSQAHVG